MSPTNETELSSIPDDQEPAILAAWMNQQLKGAASRRNLTVDELKSQCHQFLSAFLITSKSARGADMNDPEWASVREVALDIAASRIKQGFSSAETATFIFSLKRPLFDALQKQNRHGADQLEQLRTVNDLLDQVGLITMEDYQKKREGIILRQQEEMLELSTPVVKLWDGILALPVIGTLDSSRTQTVMENLLQEIVRTGSTIAIIDITGVPTVDTLVAQHLLKTVAAARLMGADCIISGIRPQIAATIVHLGVELTNVTTKATLADAFMLALRRAGLSITKVNGLPRANAAQKALPNEQGE
jgi:rsbT co-antagonist protein RsbR